MWGNLSNLTKQLSENASKIAASSGFEEHLEKARESMAGGLDAIANNILTVEPGSAPPHLQREAALGESSAVVNGARYPAPSPLRPPRHPETPLTEADGWDGTDDDEEMDGNASPDETHRHLEKAGNGAVPQLVAHQRADSSTFMEISLGDEPSLGPAVYPSPPGRSPLGPTPKETARLKQDNQRLRRENASLKKETAALRLAEHERGEAAARQAEQAQQEIDAVKRRADAAEREVHRLEGVIGVMEEQTREMQSKFEEDLHAVTKSLEPAEPLGNPGPAHEELERLRSAKARLEEEVKSFREQADSGQQAAREAQDEASRLQEALRGVETTAASSTEFFSRLLKHLGALEVSVEEAEAADLAALGAATKVAELEALCQQAGSLPWAQPGREALEGTAPQARPTGDGSALRAAQGRVAQLEKEVTALTANVQQAAAAQEKATLDYQEAVEGFQAELDAVNAKLLSERERAAEAEALRGQAESLTQALDSALQDAEAKGGMEAGLTRQLAELQAAEAEARELARKLGEEVKSSKETVRNFQREVEALGGQLADKERHLAEIQSTSQQVAETLKAAGEDKLTALQHAMDVMRQKHSEAIEGYAAELEAVQEKLEQSQTRAQDLQGQLRAVRDGSQTAQRLATDKVLSMQKRLEEAQKLAEANMKAAKQAEEGANAAMEAAASAQEKMAQREEQLRVAQEKAATLAKELAELKETAAADKEAFEQQTDAMMARSMDKARAEGRDEGAAAVQGRVEELETELADRQARIEALQEDLKQLNEEMQAAGDVSAKASEVEKSRAELEQQLREALKRAVTAEAAIEESAMEAAAHRATAAERTKKFAMLQAQFKRKETALMARAETAEAQLNGIQSSASDHISQIQAHEAAVAEAAAERDVALRKLEEAEERINTLRRKLDEQMEQCDAAVSKAAALEVSLEAAQVSSKAAEANSSVDQEYFERMVVAESSSRLAAADKRVAAAEAEVERMQDELKSCEARAQMAEDAKIEMSLALAQLDEASNLSKPISGLPTGGRSELLQKVSEKAEEAELAAKVSMRRAMTAEAELAEARKQLAEMEQKAKDLGWQVKMLSEPGTIGGSGRSIPSSRPPRASSSGSTLLDMFGCGGTRPAGAPQ